MNKELELEANNYVGNKYLAQESEAIEDFIAGATSKWVEKQKLEFAIEQLREFEAISWNVTEKIEKLEQKLIELK